MSDAREAERLAFRNDLDRMSYREMEAARDSLRRQQDNPMAWEKRLMLMLAMADRLALSGGNGNA